MLDALPEAVALVGKMIFCALVSFTAVFLVLSAWFDRKISGSEATILLLGVLAIEMLGMWLSSRGGAGMLLLAVIVLGTPVVFYLMAKLSDWRLVRSFDEEDIAKYQEAIDLDPKNVAAHSFLGDVYRRQRKLERAIQEYKAALALDRTLKSDRFWVQRLEAQLESQSRKEMTCPRCNTPRPGDADTCPECGRIYSTVELSMHAMRKLPPARKVQWAALAALATIGIMTVLALAPIVMVLLIVAAAFGAPLTVVILESRANRGMKQ
ncbi:MAG: tetratricopeptide repeat protein [Armatimonadota bacterium]